MNIIEGVVIVVSIVSIFQLIIHFFPTKVQIDNLEKIHSLKLELIKVETRYYEQNKLIEILKEKK
jgi:hypothetical protein